ncbi:hypothetical protein ACO0K9_24475 [Undibacterium sp. Ji50W]|uniref:hypothetical protein n=1 Tax=Undibacterium sp. Ji50W TaxID=3413041 RepID=UPI003BF1FDEB
MNMDIINTLITSVTTALPLLFYKAAESGAGEIGKSTALAAVKKLKDGLSHPGTTEVLDDLISEPENKEITGVLAYQLKKALTANPELITVLQEWVKDNAPAAAATVHQTAINIGNSNSITQTNTNR